MGWASGMSEAEVRDSLEAAARRTLRLLIAHGREGSDLSGTLQRCIASGVANEGSL